MEDVLSNVSLYTKVPSYGLLFNSDFGSEDYRGIARYRQAANQATFFGQNSNAQSQGSTAFGALARALDIGATAIGYAALASGRYSVAVGDQARATKFRAIAIGRQANATGIQSVSIGYAVNASGQDSIAIGANAIASGAQSVHVGSSGATSGNRAVTVGQGATNSADDATTVGQGTTISGARSTAVGQGNTITHADCVIVGKGGATSGTGQVLIGTASTVFSDVYLGRGQFHSGAGGVLNIRTAAGSGTDIFGDELNLVPGAGTGAAGNGTFRIYRTRPGSTGSTPNAYITCVQLASDGVFYLTGHPSGTLPTGISGTNFIVGPNDTPGSDEAGVVLATKSNGNAHLASLFISTTLGYMALTSTQQGSANHIPLTFWTKATGAGSPANRGAEMADGMCLNTAAGALPTGGYKGFGTLNVATDIYKNNGVYNNPDYVFEKRFTGKTDRTDARSGAKNYVPNTLAELKQFAQTNFKLKLVHDTLHDARQARKDARIAEFEALRGKTLKDVQGNDYQWSNAEIAQEKAKIQAMTDNEIGDGMFDRADALLAQLEELTLHLFDIDDRLKALEV